MGNFQFKQFSIRDDNSAMKVGTDAVLLGALASHSNPKNILDIGAGTGIVGLMLAQRFDAHVHLVEIDQKAALDVEYNIANSPFSHRMSVEVSGIVESKLDDFDLIVSNPPFHVEMYHADGIERQKARHAQHLPPLVLSTQVKNRLNAQGLYWMISTVKYYDLFKSMTSLSLIEKINVLPKTGGDANRIISTWSVYGTLERESDFIIRNEDNDYSEAYKLLTKDFHPQF